MSWKRSNQVKINRKELLTALESVTPGLSSKEIIEQSASFVFHDGRAITFNDEVAASVACDLGIEGAVTAEPLLALLRKLEEDELEVEAKEGQFTVKGNRRRAGIRMEAQVTLPIDVIEKPGKWTKLPEKFVEAVGIVGQCASHDDSQFILTCVHLHPEWVEACDNLQVCRYPVKTGFSKPLLVRRSALKSVADAGVVEFSECENWIHFRNVGKVVLSCRRYAEQYPDLGKLLMVKGTKTGLPKDLGDAVDKAVIFSARTDNENQVTVELRPGKVKVVGEGTEGWYREVKDVDYQGTRSGSCCPRSCCWRLCEGLKGSRSPLAV
jgi:hypothetical protein